MNVRRLCVLVAALIVCAWAAPAAAQTTLRYRFKQGDVLKFVREQKMKLTRTVMGNAAEFTVDQHAEFTWTIGSVDAMGVAAAAITFGHSKTTMDGPTGTIVIDSRSEEPPDDPTGKVLHRVVRGLAGLEVHGTLNSLGQFSNVQVPEKKLKEFRGMPGSEAFDELLSADGLKRISRQNALILPTQPVTQGSTWKAGTLETKLPFGKSIVDEECTCAGAETKSGRSLVKITIKQRARLEPEPKSEVTVKLKSHDGSGVAWFDNAAGRLMESTLQESIEREFDLNGVAVTEKSSQKTTLRSVK